MAKGPSWAGPSGRSPAPHSPAVLAAWGREHPAESAPHPRPTPHPFSSFFLVFRELALVSTVFEGWSVAPSPRPGTWFTQGVLGASACPSSFQSSERLPLQLQGPLCRGAGAHGGQKPGQDLPWGFGGK